MKKCAAKRDRCIKIPKTLSLPEDFHIFQRVSAPLGLLLSVVTKQSSESLNYMRSFTPYFRRDCGRKSLQWKNHCCTFLSRHNKNTTQNPLINPNFHRLPKRRFESGAPTTNVSGNPHSQKRKSAIHILPSVSIPPRLFKR